MKRFFVSLCALLLSITVALGSPPPLDAAPPPPCPTYDTFIFCEEFCPGDVSDYCLAQVGFPANCRVEQPFCEDINPAYCDSWGHSYPDKRIWCPYVPQYP